MRRLTFLIAALLALVAVLGAGIARGDEDSPSREAPLLSTSTGIEGAEGKASEVISVEKPDQAAAEKLPQEELNREESLEVLEEVFAPTLEGPAAVFSALDEAKLLGPNVAAIPTDSEGQAGRLIDSTVPLQSRVGDGELKPVDLSLERNDGAISPANPVVDVDIPANLSDPIELPDAGITIQVGDVQSRDASISESDAAFYPNTNGDSDVVITPSPVGIETLTQIRSKDAPLTQSYELAIPAGANLKETPSGGAIVTKDDEILLTTPPPSAVDADGASVPTELRTEGNSISVSASPSDETAYPILVDPLFQSYNWPPEKEPAAKGIYTGASGYNQYLSIFTTMHHEEWSPEVVHQPSAWEYFLANNASHNYNGTHGLDIQGPDGTGKPSQQYAGDHSAWVYTVPRYFSDIEKYGVAPESFISHMTLTNLLWSGYSEVNSPYLEAGINRADGTWSSLLSHEGKREHNLTDPNFAYQFSNADPAGKLASVGIWNAENWTSTGGVANIYVGAATVELSEPSTSVPKFGLPLAGSEKWSGQSPAPIEFNASDNGLGVYSISLTPELAGNWPTWKTTYGCTGVGGDPCPHTWLWSEAGHPTLKWDPTVLPTGITKLKIVAEDPLGHVSAASRVEVAVDHMSPTLAVGGSITEQASLGTSRPTYEVEISSKDGTTENPQSGVAKTAIEVDGKVVNESNPGCATQNCSVSRKWTLESSQYTTGSHVLKVVSTDAVGNTQTTSQNFKLQPAAAPSVEISGSATQQATLGTSRPRYVLNAKATTSAGFNGMPMAAPTYASSLGSAGTGKGQFSSVRGTVVDSQGNLWAVDRGNGRVEEFNAKGEYLTQFGEPGSNPGQLSQPYGLARDSGGNFWVTSSDDRIEEFSAAGKFIKQFGKFGTADGLLNAPVDLAFDAKGNLWVLENGNNRVQEFNTEGKFLKKFGSEGYGNGQFRTPWGIAIAPDGSIWVADTWNGRIQKFDAEGKFLSAFGEPGEGNGKFIMPQAIRVDQAGNLYVSEALNRVQVFNSAGEYLTQFGSSGKGAGQFTQASYIALDPAGNVWVDNSDSEVQRWRAAVPPPTFSLSFGSKGTGAGQFTTPSGITTDSAGNVWVVDRANARIEKFNSKGEFLTQFGTKGSGAGQLSSPWGVAIDPSGNVWVTDTTNVRVVEFNSKGEFVATFGTNVNKTKVEAAGTQAEKNLCTAASKNVCQAGTAGSAEGQLKTPTGITTSAGGNIFVVEKGNGRVEKFSPTGELLANFGKPGTAAGQLTEPSAVAMSPDGNYLWVADSGNSRIQEWTSTYSFVRAVGKEGTGNGQFIEPYGISIDSKGNVWVADTWDNRIQGFTSEGDFVTKFGKSGTGEGQLSAPYALTADSTGNLWLADTSHNQIQKWIPPTSKASTIATEVTIDGKAVNTKVGRCGTETCAVESEWTLEAGAYAAGKHTIQVKGTDGLGRSTTKTLEIELQKDETKPTLETTGALATAPEGWVEQQSYNLSATATDAGYGVTSLIATIDGKQVASWTNACPDGGCKATFSKAIDMNAYSGGSHPAEVVATDGAGNVAKKVWTINVDPDGTITNEEAEDTLEAADATANTTVVAPNSEIIPPEERAEGNNPVLAKGAEGQLESSGVPDVSVIGVNPEDGFEIGIPESTVEVEPVTTNPGASSTSVISASAGVASNTQKAVDTVLRPVYNGIMSFQSIRESSAPETYSWELVLRKGQTAKQVDTKDVEIDLADGSQALMIAAEPAHDAVETEVPTTLSLSEGHIITLKVEHHAKAFVYPVVAGSGWKGVYTTEYVARPLDELEIYEARAKREAEEQKLEEKRLKGEGCAAGWLADCESYPIKPVGYNHIGPPYPLPNGATDDEGASASSAGGRGMVMPYSYDQCTYEGPGGCEPYDLELAGRFEYNGRYAWWKKGANFPHCEYSSKGAGVTEDYCKWVGPNHQLYGAGYHISSQAMFHVSPLGGPINMPEPITEYMYGDGYANGHNTTALCNPLKSC